MTLRSAFDGAHRNTAHEVPLQRRDGEQDRQRAEHRHGRDLRPEVGLPAEVMCYLNRVGHDFRPREDEREQEVVPHEHEGEYRGCEQAGPRHREHDPPKDLPPTAAVDFGALLELERNVLNISAHHPNHVGKTERHVKQDEPAETVDKAEGHVEEEHRENDRDRRQHALRDDPDREVLSARLEPLDRIGSERAEYHRDRRRNRGQDEAVPHGGPIAVSEQHSEIREVEAARPPHGRVGKDLVGRLEGHDYKPVDRKQKEDDERKGRQKPGRPDESATPDEWTVTTRGPLSGYRHGADGLSLAHRASPIRLTAAVTASVRMAMIR